MLPAATGIAVLCLQPRAFTPCYGAHGRRIALVECYVEELGDVEHMPDFRVVPIGEPFAQRVRTSRKAPGYGHPVHAEVATGYGPCRVCLRTFREGEERRLLCTYDPFFGRDPFPLPGPIFIHEHDCAPYAQTDQYPGGLRFIPLTFNAYAPGRRLVAQARIDNGYDRRFEETVSRLFGDANVAYIHVRNTEAGCFIVHLERPVGPVAGSSPGGAAE